MGERALGANLARERVIMALRETERESERERQTDRERERERERRNCVVENPKGKSMGVKESGKGQGGSSLA